MAFIITRGVEVRLTSYVRSTFHHIQRGLRQHTCRPSLGRPSARPSVAYPGFASGDLLHCSLTAHTQAIVPAGETAEGRPAGSDACTDHAGSHEPACLTCKVLVTAWTTYRASAGSISVGGGLGAARLRITHVTSTCTCAAAMSAAAKQAAGTQ